MPSFTHPKHKGRTNNNYYPILQTQTANIKKLLKAWYLYHCYLSNHNDSHNGKQSFTTFEMQCTTPSLKSTCVEKIEDSSVGANPNQNYDRAVNYSKGEDKIKHEKITKIEQVCDREDFPKIMEDARNSIKSFTSFLTPKMTVDEYLKHTHYKYINRLAEDMLQAGLDDGTINTQFLSTAYNFPRRSLNTGSLLPRCKINR